MTQAIKWVYLVSLGVWVGSIIFFSFVAAPTIFKVLKLEDAARLQRVLFPKYYLVGLICTGIGIVCAGLLVAERAFAKWPGVLSLLLLAALGATNLWLRQAVVPQMTGLRDRRAALAAEGKPADPELEEEWKGMHRLSVQLNGAVLICVLALMYLVVFSRVA